MLLVDDVEDAFIDIAFRGRLRLDIDEFTRWDALWPRVSPRRSDHFNRLFWPLVDWQKVAIGG